MIKNVNKIKRNKNYMKMAELYKEYNPFNDVCTYTDKDLLEAYNVETHGLKVNNNIFDRKKHNGYIIGKKYMDVTFSIWKNWVDDYGWAITISMLMDKDLDKIPGWVVKTALDEHIKNTWFYNCDYDDDDLKPINKTCYRVNDYDEHLKLIDKLEEEENVTDNRRR